MSNMELWQAVEKTPTTHVKPITGKSYTGNSPKPHYLVWKATETFGPCGVGWGFTVLDERIENGPGEEKMHIARVRVWYEWQGKRGEVEHIGGTPFAGVRSSGKPFMDEDAPKKSVTDALVKALSMIGFAGDIFMGRYDDSKYLAELRREESADRQAGDHGGDKQGAQSSAGSDKGSASTQSSGEQQSGPPAWIVDLFAKKHFLVAVTPNESGAGSDWPRWGSEFKTAMRWARNLQEFNKLWADNEAPLGNCPEDMRKVLEDIRKKRLAFFSQAPNGKAA